MLLNLSTHRDTDDDDLDVSIFTSRLSPGADLCLGLAILLVVLLSILGNGLVLVISYRRRKRMVGSELLCVNLAVVDVLSCICFYPLSMLSSFNHAWLGRNVTCVYYGLGCFIFGLCGMFTIAAISIIRYMKTCYSLVYAVWLEGANIRLVCFATWLIPTVWSCFPLFGWGQYVPEPYGLSCTIAWSGFHTSVKDAVFVICSFACFTLVPIVLIVVSQCRILYKVYRFSYSLSGQGIRNNLRHAEKRLSMMFFCISLGFVMAWAPYTVVSLLFVFHKDNWNMSPAGFVFPALFAKSSHIYNPFIYFYFNKAFQKELCSLFHSLCPGLVGHRVGVRSATVPQEAHPIQIQLQEQGYGPGGNSCFSQGKSKSKHTGSNHCWGSKLRVTPSRVDNKHVK